MIRFQAKPEEAASPTADKSTHSKVSAKTSAAAKAKPATAKEADLLDRNPGDAGDQTADTD